MKKLIVLIIVVAMLLTACSPGGSDDYVVEITERFFVNQTTEVLRNPERYLGRTIRLEGIFITVQLPGVDDDFHFVHRLTDGCCGPIEPIGFEVRLDGIAPLPDDTWVEVIGVLEQYENIWQHDALRLEVASLTEMSERGAEFVAQ